MRIELPDDVLYVEAEAYDPVLSAPEVGPVKWEVREDPEAFGGKYVTVVGG